MSETATRTWRRTCQSMQLPRRQLGSHCWAQSSTTPSGRCALRTLARGSHPKCRMRDAIQRDPVRRRDRRAVAPPSHRVRQPRLPRVSAWSFRTRITPPRTSAGLTDLLARLDEADHGASIAKRCGLGEIARCGRPDWMGSGQCGQCQRANPRERRDDGRYTRRQARDDSTAVTRSIDDSASRDARCACWAV